jgi:hypothetical protein
VVVLTSSNGIGQGESVYPGTIGRRAVLGGRIHDDYRDAAWTGDFLALLSQAGFLHGTRFEVILVTNECEKSDTQAFFNQLGDFNHRLIPQTPTS